MDTNSISQFVKTTSDSVSFGANFVTLILGGIAIWGLIFRRKKIALIMKLMISNFTNERVKRLKETLGKLESLSYDEKPDRPEIHALLGQVSGQIKILATEQNGLMKINQDISDILAKKSALNEATKRRIVYELHGSIDTISFTETNNIAS